ncbi:HAD-IA family hydrolase [Paenibacillus sp. GD4]|uniref:HAD family hydrolase n=1 Tax=Paenibacillus sp. GD4 TaxID=3068890 RepID=UPI0027964A79|nr:HAD-IA family hydrolase [Paenibacillus sp. GD4]MDQ1914330.1 HAD-IA family hydrolase [Paenibacillus sp. GD4]
MVIKAVFFDLFETLISEYENGKRKALRSTHFVEQLGIESKVFDKEWNERQEKRMDGTYSDFPSVLREIFTCLGHEVSIEIINAIHMERVKSKSIPFSRLDDEIVDMLEQIKALGIKICLISNCAFEEVSAWESCKLAKYFDDVIFSYAVKMAKPNSEIYQLACKRMDVSPSESLFVGDGGSNELQGAAQVGMVPYHATWFIPPFKSEKITDFPKLIKPSELLTLLRA